MVKNTRVRAAGSGTAEADSQGEDRLRCEELPATV